MNQKDKDDLLAASLRIKPIGAPSAEINASNAAQEFLESVNTGHPGGKTSFAQLAVADFSADDAAAMLKNNKLRVLKPLK